MNNKKENHNNLYLLMTESSNKLIAYSNELSILSTYWGQFCDSANQNDYKVEILQEANMTDQLRIRYLHTNYSHMEISQIYSNLYLTELEWKFYKNKFLELYDSVKSTVTGMFMLNDITMDKDIQECTSHFKDIGYEKYRTFDLFMEDFNRTYIFHNIIMEPISTQLVNQEQSDLLERYKYLMEKE